MESAGRVLEVGCGTGAILGELAGPAALHGLDRDPAALAECGLHVSAALRTRGDACDLPYPSRAFDIVFCHYLLLWVDHPLRAVREMKRVARAGGHVLALAEPDYAARVDQPASLEPLGRWQAEALRRQGADPGFGARLAATFAGAGLRIVETGRIQPREDVSLSPSEIRSEWDVLESDLADFVPAGQLQKMRELDTAAWLQGRRTLLVPTYFAWGRA
jgi:SAM-dependent methyltransferase